MLRGRFIHRELSACLGAGEAEESLQIATMYPMLYECVMDDQRSGVEMRQCVEEIVRGEGDEVLVLKKSQLVALPPYTMCAFSLGLTRSVVVLRGRIVAPEGEISVIVRSSWRGVRVVRPREHPATAQELLLRAVGGGVAAVRAVQREPELHEPVVPGVHLAVLHGARGGGGGLHRPPHPVAGARARRLHDQGEGRGGEHVSASHRLQRSIVIVSGRVRSTRSSAGRQESRYKLKYRLSYDSRHVFSEKEKEEVAHRMKEKEEERLAGQRADEVVVSVCRRARR